MGSLFFPNSDLRIIGDFDNCIIGFIPRAIGLVILDKDLSFSICCFFISIGSMSPLKYGCFNASSAMYY